jgi:hypothetical protein
MGDSRTCLGWLCRLSEAMDWIGEVSCELRIFLVVTMRIVRSDVEAEGTVGSLSKSYGPTVGVAYGCRYARECEGGVGPGLEVRIQNM